MTPTIEPALPDAPEPTAQPACGGVAVARRGLETAGPHFHVAQFETPALHCRRRRQWHPPLVRSFVWHGGTGPSYLSPGRSFARRRRRP